MLHPGADLRRHLGLDPFDFKGTAQARAGGKGPGGRLVSLTIGGLGAHLRLRHNAARLGLGGKHADFRLRQQHLDGLPARAGHQGLRPGQGLGRRAARTGFHFYGLFRDFKRHIHPSNCRFSL